jgi:flagellin
MGFRIQNNIVAMNAHRNLGISDSGMARSLERLSSGYRINSAADDAAGLSISQAFRADIASYKVAQRNVSEANSMLQVGEGALDQVGTMLTRMKELATQASSANAGSNLDKINAEYSQLKLEVDRIANSTEYAGTKLLDGTLGASVPGPSTAGPMSDSTFNTKLAENDRVRYRLSPGLSSAGVELTAFNDYASHSDGMWSLHKEDAGTVSITDGSVTDTATVSGNNDILFATLGITITNSTSLTTDDLDGEAIFIWRTGLNSLDVSGADAGTYTITDPLDPSDDTMTISNGTKSQTITGVLTGVSQTLNFNELGIILDLGADYITTDVLTGLNFDVTAGAPGSTGAVFQVGNENNGNNQISISMGSARTADIGKNSGGTAVSLGASSLSTAANAQDALQVIDKAISDVSAFRGEIGADQNRFSYAAANLATTVENITAADSVIRDTDMADEMTSFSRNQILVQAGTAMLAQANTTAQQVLSLLK